MGLPVAEVFEKEHRHVLRDVERLITMRPDLVSSLQWLRRSSYVDGAGRSQVAFEMTRDGLAQSS